MRILVIGSGMYVTGRHDTGNGTILASLLQITKSNLIQEIHIVSKNDSSKEHVLLANEQINAKLGSTLSVTFEAIPKGIDDLELILQQRTFDCAIVCVPDHLHYEYIKCCLNHKVATLVVKPLTPSYEQAAELIAIAERNQTYGAVEFHKRYDESNLYAKRVLDEGKIGELSYIQVDYSQKIKVPTEIFREWSSKTNILQYLGIHYIDLIHYLTGFMPSRVSAYGTKNILVKKSIDTYDSIHAFIEWTHPLDKNKSFLSVINANWIDANAGSAMSDQKIKFIGTEGRLECDQKDRGIELVNENSGVQLINPYFSEYLPGNDQFMALNGYGFKSIERFVLDVLNLQKGVVSIEALNEQRPSFKSGSIATLVSDYANKSLANNNAWIEIKR